MPTLLLTILLTVGALLLIQLVSFAFILSKEALRPRETKEAVAGSKNQRRGKFFNRTPAPLWLGPKSLFTMFGRMIFGKEKRTPPGPLPQIKPGKEIFATPSPCRVTWIGHSTTLIELGKVRFLTDPIFSPRCSPVSFAGPKRFQPPALCPGELPPLSAVLITHNHYDHLDKASIKALRKHAPLFIVPLGLSSYLLSWGVPRSKIVELDWDQSTAVRGVNVTATPTAHFSGRALERGNRTLWCSYVLKSADRRVYFGGDSGYSSIFQTIGQEHGPFDLTLLEIGASDPSWPHVHLGPEGALRAHRDLKGELLIPIHWGTFKLALHDWDAPPKKLTLKAKEQQQKIHIPMQGHPIEPHALPPQKPWWHLPLS